MTITAKEIATRRKVTPERARQIARQLGTKVGDRWVVDEEKYETWARTTPQRGGKPKKSGAKKSTSKAPSSAPAPTLNGTAALINGVLSDRSLTDKEARFIAKYLVRNAG